MKSICEKIRKEGQISKCLRNASKEVNYNKAWKIREEQDKHWDKLNFLKNLERALEEREK